MIPTMLVRPCPICRKPVSWETVPTRPFCSERCKLLDLGAWASEAYELPADPSEAAAWSSGAPGEPGP